MKITTREQVDALPVLTSVRDAFGAVCTRVRTGRGGFDWVRVTPAVKRGRHYHRPYLPAQTLDGTSQTMECACAPGEGCTSCPK